MAAVQAVVQRPHGGLSVDMTFDHDGVACPTEIQPSRFFTSIDFLAELGANFPAEYCRLGLGGAVRTAPLVNPIRDEYYWVRAVDMLPILMTRAEFAKQ